MTLIERERRTTIVVLALAVLVPMALLLDVSDKFYVDWYSHFFSIGYFGEYIRQHFSLPVLMNTDIVVGAPNAVFYATLFYPIAGIVSAFLGANLGVRLILIAVFALQTWQVYVTARTFSQSRWLAYSVTIGVDASIYTLTNLYNRSDLTEFVGLALIAASIAAWLRLPSLDGPGRWLTATQVGLYLGIAVTTSPIIILLGSALMAFVVVLTLLLCPNRRATCGAALLIAVISGIMLAPWIYAYLRYQPIQSAGSVFSVGGPSYTPGIDEFGIRFLPFPFDAQPSTPHLDGQFNVALEVVILFLFVEAWRLRKVGAYLFGAIVCLGAGLTVGLYSAPPTPAMALHVLSAIQDTYRLVGYVDLLLLVTVLLLLLNLGTAARGSDKRHAIFFAVLVAIALPTVVYKESRANVTAGIVPGSGFRDNRNSLALSWGTALDYPVAIGPVTKTDPQQHVTIPVGVGQDFGSPQTVTVNAPAGSLIATNVQSFPWNHLVVNGQELASADTQVVAADPMRLALAFTTSSAQPQTVGVSFRPDGVWIVLRAVSFWFAIGLGFALALANLRRSTGRARAAVALASA